VPTDRSAWIAASGPLYAPFPPYVQGEDAPLRWKVCGAVAASAAYEPDGQPSAFFVWNATWGLYNSDEPTGAHDAEAICGGRRVPRDVRADVSVIAERSVCLRLCARAVA
jgi:hypothetical protein